jgi:hypothetical protein
VFPCEKREYINDSSFDQSPFESAKGCGGLERDRRAASTELWVIRQLEPNVLHGHTGGERVGAIGEPFSKGRTAAGASS